MNKVIVRKLRCAVYTRKSSEEGLDQEFNSLDAQRDACEAYIASQKAEGWLLVRDHYDDGGISGATLERPALQRLLADIEAGRIDVVVVYKIDRLSRALMDFAKLVEVFDRNKVTFVSVTQSFNTTTSMGRLTLNILLSFAQFEREVIGERIRDKFRASRSRGMWMGRHPPLGYDVKDRKLVVNEVEAATVCMIFERFVRVGSATTLARSLAAEGVLTKRGRLIDRGYLYILLNNRTYIGEAVHKGTAHGASYQTSDTGEQDFVLRRRSCGNTDNQTCGGNNTVVGAEYCGSEPSHTGDEMRFRQMKAAHRSLLVTWRRAISQTSDARLLQRSAEAPDDHLFCALIGGMIHDIIDVEQQLRKIVVRVEPADLFRSHTSWRPGL
jgi:DNA invertase Pin-like site-specific DNA recombinase